MNADTFFQFFDLLAEAPNSVAKLRELILQLAIQGKLVEQDTSEEPASKLVIQIAAGRQKLISDGIIRDIEPLPKVEPHELPFKIPTNWVWVRLGDVMHMLNGKAFKPTDWNSSGIPIIRIQNLNNENAAFNYCTPEDLDDRHRVRNGDFLISWSGTPGTSFGAFIWERGDAALNQHIFRCPLFGSAYSKPFLRTAVNARLDEMIAQAHGGVGLQHITNGKLERLCIPLPPLAEQHRIVAKVDELLGLCDELETRQGARRELRERLVQAALDQLLASRDPADFATNWQRILTNFDILFDTPESVERLRVAILQVGLMGRLIDEGTQNLPQSDTSVDSRMPSETRPRKRSRSGAADTTEVEPLFELPPLWSWRRLSDLLVDLRYGTSKKCELDSGGTPVLRIPNLKAGEVDFSVLKYAHLEPKELQDLSLREDDLLMIRSNGSSSLVGRTAVVSNSAAGFAYAGYLVRLRLDTRMALSRFVRLALDAPSSRRQIELPIRTTSGVKNINSSEIGRVALPVPPLPVQSRLVERINELWASCSDLEHSLNLRSDSIERLISVAIEHLQATEPNQCKPCSGASNSSLSSRTAAP